MSPATTCNTDQESSCVDLILHRGPEPPSIIVLPSYPLSYHRLVQAQLSLSTIKPMKVIALSMLANAKCGSRAVDSYSTSLLQMFKVGYCCSTPASLTINARRLAPEAAQPWESMFPPRPRRFHPGCTLALDMKSKLRSRLLKSANPDNKRPASILDKEINRSFRRSMRRLKARIVNEMTTSDPSKVCQTLKRALALT